MHKHSSSKHAAEGLFSTLFTGGIYNPIKPNAKINTNHRGWRTEVKLLERWLSCLLSDSQKPKN